VLISAAGASSVRQMVFTICGGQLVGALAPSLPDDTALSLGSRPNLGPPRAAYHESLCHRVIDGLSTVCSDRTSNNNKCSNDFGFRPAQRPLEAVGSRLMPLVSARFPVRGEVC